MKARSKGTAHLTTVRGSIYDFPHYYDILFGAEWRAEMRFLKACFRKFADRKVKRVFEPACGTGRLLVKLAEAGFTVSGNDLNPRAVAYCNAALTRAGTRSRVTLGDMSDFKVERKYDAAFNLISTVRELPSDAKLKDHLRCMARALNPGGIYLLGLHLTPEKGKPFASEVWKAARGNVKIFSKLWTEFIDRKGRSEEIGVMFSIRTPTKRMRILDTMHYRTYTATQMKRILGGMKSFELLETFDFNCDIKSPIEIDARTQDAIYVLRKVR